MSSTARTAIAILAVCIGVCVAGCSTSPIKDYEAFYAQTPYTIAVLPVINETADAEAPRYFLATIAKPLIDRGYYVLPVQATAEILTAEGLGDGGALVQVKPQKFRDFFGADALLRVTLKTWDTAYIIFASSVTVAIHYELVATTSGDILWEVDQEETIHSQSGGGGLGGLIAGIVNAAVTAAATDYVPMAADVNVSACSTLPPGPYNSRFEEMRNKYLEEARRRKEKEQSKAPQGI